MATNWLSLVRFSYVHVLDYAVCFRFQHALDSAVLMSTNSRHAMQRSTVSAEVHNIELLRSHILKNTLFFAQTIERAVTSKEYMHCFVSITVDGIFGLVSYEIQKQCTHPYRCCPGKRSLPEPKVSDNVIYENLLTVRDLSSRILQQDPNGGRLVNVLPPLNRSKLTSTL